MIVAKLAVSRPLRAFTVVVSSWAVMRVAVLWTASAAVIPSVVTLSAADLMPVSKPLSQPIEQVATVPRRPPIGSESSFVARVPRRSIAHERAAFVGDTAQSVTGPPFVANKIAAADQRPETATFVNAWSPPVTTTRRFSGSAWALFRPNSTAPVLGSGGTLGGSQTGLRIFYEPGPKGFALTGRLSAPIAFRLGREASVGVGVRGRIGGLLLERRIALDTGGRNAMSITAYGGVSDIVLPLGFRLNGYAQAGIVGAKTRDGFADGLAQIVYPIAGRKSAKLSIGGALAGSVQPGVARIDAGPELMGDLYIGTKSFRLTAGWRQRLTGNAAPDSGPAVSLGAGF